MNCGCGNEVEEARAELGFMVCRACAFTGPDVPKPRGRQVYGHKTGCEIEIHSAESWERNKKYFIPSGARSCVKNFSRSVCA
jgi:hypothetical protein